MLGPPIPGIHHQLDVLQLSQRHIHLGKRHRARTAYRRDRIQLNRHRFHGSAPYGKTSGVSSYFGAATKRTYGFTECLRIQVTDLSVIKIYLGFMWVTMAKGLELRFKLSRPGPEAARRSSSPWTISG